MLAGGTVDPAPTSATRETKAGQDVAVIVSLVDRVSLRSFAPGGRGTRDSSPNFVAALRSKATSTQGPVVGRAAAIGGHGAVSLWAINAIALSIPQENLTALAQIPGVRSVRLDAVIQAPGPSAASAPGSPAWNISMLGAPDLWAAGHTGSGVVVANLDTGVDAQHPDLASRWRGGPNSWYDPNGQYATPHDTNGHGTQTMGLIVGGTAGGTAIGMAPNAVWIAAKIFNDAGQATLSGIHLAFQWLLDPDGDPATVDSPQVVNNSWNFPSTAGTCWTEFGDDIAVLRAAGIGVVFSAGNDGPSSGSSVSPANDTGAFSAGAVDPTRTVASFSSRGPSACDGGIFPKVVAPGVSVRTSDLTFGGVIPDPYTVVSGTSFSAPHVAGAMALLWSAHPAATLSAMETALESTAIDLGVAGPDNSYGHGLPSVTAAHALLSALGPPPVAIADAFSAPAGWTLSVGAPGLLGNDSSPSGHPLTALLSRPPSAGSLTLALDGSFRFVAPATAGVYGFSYRASDGIQQSAETEVTITVTASSAALLPDSYQATAGATLVVPAPGVLGNDTGPSGQPLVATVSLPPSAGQLTFRSDGSFSFVAPSTAGTITFSYAAIDGAVWSSEAAVTIDVLAHPAPVALNDSFVVARNSGPLALDVLANDEATAPASILRSNFPPNNLSPRIMSAPTGGGSVLVQAGGTVRYRPAPNFQGLDVFTYRFRDSLGATSNVATVTVNVQ